MVPLSATSAEHHAPLRDVVNGDPHTHEPTIYRKFGYGKWVVQYGDQRATVTWRWANPATERFRQKAKRATAVAIADHDRASQKEARKAAAVLAAEQAAGTVRSNWQ